MKIIHYREAALEAVVFASDATATVASYLQEGPKLPDWPFGNLDPTIALARALVHVAQIEQDACEVQGEPFNDEVEQLGQLIAGLEKFISDWNGM